MRLATLTLSAALAVLPHYAAAQMDMTVAFIGDRPVGGHRAMTAAQGGAASWGLFEDAQSLTGLSQDGAPLLVLEAPETFDPDVVEETLDILGDWSEPVTYMVFADTAAALDPLAEVEVPDNVKLVSSVRALDRALIAQSHEAAGTGYDGAFMDYDIPAAIDLATEQFATYGTGAASDRVKPWRPGKRYAFFDHEIVQSGAPEDAGDRLAAHATPYGGVSGTWREIEGGAFQLRLPGEEAADMRGVYLVQAGQVCGSQFPWNIETESPYRELPVDLLIRDR